MWEYHKKLVQRSTTDNNQEPTATTHNNPKQAETNDTDLNTWTNMNNVKQLQDPKKIHKTWSCQKLCKKTM